MCQSLITVLHPISAGYKFTFLSAGGHVYEFWLQKAGPAALLSNPNLDFMLSGGPVSLKKNSLLRVFMHFGSL